jgi:hypothetical protein
MKVVINNEVVELTPEELVEYEKNYIFEESTYKDKIILAIRQKYSIDDELAILRQRDSKPEEFKEYFDFVENIKQTLKENEITELETEQN